MKPQFDLKSVQLIRHVRKLESDEAKRIAKDAQLHHVEAVSKMEQAQIRLAFAQEEWNRYVCTERLNPILLKAVNQQLVHAQEALYNSKDAVKQADIVCDTTQLEFQTSLSRESVAEILEDNVRRQKRKSRTLREMADLEEKVARDWSAK